MTELYSAGGSWYKGNLHMHTTDSDGVLTPDAAFLLYRKAGYDFIAITDHWVQTKNRIKDGCLILNGCEWDTGDMIRTPMFHILGIGMEAPVTLDRFRNPSPQTIINAINAAGGIAILAHPAWSVTDPADCMPLEGLSGAEIYNSISTLPWNGRRSDSSIYFDIWASGGKFIPCTAADDSHYYNGEQTRSFIMVNAGELTPEAIKTSIRSGNFYASQGPFFESIRYNASRVQVHCSEVETVIFYSNTVWCHDRVATGGVTSATYEIKPTDRYVRIELIDKNGNMAWSSPFPVNK